MSLFVRRFRWTLCPLAAAGAIVCFGTLLRYWSLGGWPPHDTTAYWAAGARLAAGEPVYGDAVEFLAFFYAPPWAVIFAPLSYLRLDVVCVGLLIGQIVGLRYIAGSWLVVGLLGWLPLTHDALSIGNIDFIVGAAILAGVRRVRWAGPLIVLTAAAKISPALALTRATLHGAVVTGIALIAITVPWFYLWGDWIEMLTQIRDSSFATVPILPRIPLVLGLLWFRRPWSVAAAAALATPAFYFHSLVLLAPAARLALDGQLSSVREAAPTASTS